MLYKVIQQMYPGGLLGPARMELWSLTRQRRAGFNCFSLKSVSILTLPIQQIAFVAFLDEDWDAFNIAWLRIFSRMRNLCGFHFLISQFVFPSRLFHKTINDTVYLILTCAYRSSVNAPLCSMLFEFRAPLHTNAQSRRLPVRFTMLYDYGSWRLKFVSLCFQYQCILVSCQISGYVNCASKSCAYSRFLLNAPTPNIIFSSVTALNYVCYAASVMSSIALLRLHIRHAAYATCR